MNWKLKALIQNSVAALPSDLSYWVYYQLQRRFGALAVADPVESLRRGAYLAALIHKQGKTIRAKSFLEIGTGRQLNLPIAFWLCGADRIYTVDINPYLTYELVMEDIEYIRHHQDQIVELFGICAHQSLFMDRLKKLMTWEGEGIESLLALINTTYIVQRDTSSLRLSPNSIDYHVSCCVCEHVPPAILKKIFIESKKILKMGGLLIHLVDFSDHFSHSDNSISAINFLKYSEHAWNFLAGNKFMYQNRLRIDDFKKILIGAGLVILDQIPRVDDVALKSLKCGFRIDPCFSGKPVLVNATVSAWVLAKVSDLFDPRALNDR